MSEQQLDDRAATAAVAAAARARLNTLASLVPDAAAAHGPDLGMVVATRALTGDATWTRHWLARVLAAALERINTLDLRTDADVVAALRSAADAVERDGGTFLTATWAADAIRERANELEANGG